MRFDLTEALIDDILFSMEDQNGEFLLDTQGGKIVLTGEISDDPDEREDRYIDLPEWDSASGYQLMEHFTAALRNPVAREELNAALNRGKGVFRAFKDILSQYPEVEKRWFAYKEREMKRTIIRWYNGLREEWGLEKIGTEPEETEDLVLEDFRFREAGPSDARAAESLHRICREEYLKYTREENPAAGVFLEDLPWPFPGSLALAAETGGGDFAGYVAAAGIDPVLRVFALEVKPEYRGLGVGETLMSRFLEKAREGPYSRVTMELPPTAEGFSRGLLRETFKPYAVRYCMELDKSRGEY
ncbi:MAG: GNAT family N-acetyltransferase [Treponema sp.]|jgi:ribosomal protein S18 acetylase RimI-like enzyme|nr:GNAT family N-acetyltransferase [Treponema sp.]